jgi:hypothetical protein
MLLGSDVSEEYYLLIPSSAGNGMHDIHSLGLRLSLR